MIVWLLLGGSGVAAVAHLLIHNPYPIDEVRFLGGAIVHDDLTPLGHRVSALMDTAGREPRDLPMEPLSYFLTKGDFHPPLSRLPSARVRCSSHCRAQETGNIGRARNINNALLAATLPLAFISNTWIVPLQLLLVGGWFLFRVARGERSCLLPAFIGAVVTTALEYPFLVEFTQQAVGDNAAIRMIGADHAPPGLDHHVLAGRRNSCAWPIRARSTRPLSLFFVGIWSFALLVTEYFYNHDIYGRWARFNSTLKWWQWIYAAIVLTLGSLNLGSRSRVIRYGTMLFLLPCLLFAYDLRQRGSWETSKEAAGRMTGAAWIREMWWCTT